MFTGDSASSPFLPGRTETNQTPFFLWFYIIFWPKIFTIYIPPSEWRVEGGCLVREWEWSYLSISIVSSLTSSAAPGCALWQLYQRRWAISLLTLAAPLQPSDSYTQLYTIITEGSLVLTRRWSHVGGRLRLLRYEYISQVLFCYSVSMFRGQYGGSTGAAILRRYYGHKAAVPAAHRSPAPRCLIGRFYWRKCGVTSTLIIKQESSDRWDKADIGTRAVLILHTAGHQCSDRNICLPLTRQMKAEWSTNVCE